MPHHRRLNVLLVVLCLLALRTTRDAYAQSGDPLAGQQWALDVTGARGAWAQLRLPLRSVAVAILSDGVCADHPDLRGRLLPGRDFFANSKINTTAETQRTQRSELLSASFASLWFNLPGVRGCALASIIAANVGDGVGMAGIAPNAQIMPLRVVGADGVVHVALVAEAVRYAADAGAALILIPFTLPERSQAVEDAVDYAIRRGARVITAAGDGERATQHPARYLPAIAVGAADRDLRPAVFSANDADIDFFAPGVGILAATPDGGYADVAGSDAAAAVATGVLALQIAREGAPTYASINGIATVSSPPRSSDYLEIYTQDVWQLEREFAAPLRAALERERAWLPPEARFVVSAFRREGDWARVTLLPPIFVSSVPTRRIEAIDPYVVDAVGWGVGEEQWVFEVVGSPAYEAALPLIPTGVIDWRSPLPPMAGAYRLPWEAGQAWWAINGWHDGNALDFQPRLNSASFAVLAAEAGYLRELCYDGYQSLLQIRHADGNATYYLHVNPDPVLRRQILDQNVERGRYLGELVRAATFRNPCGEGRSRHLHFASAERGIVIDGYALEDIAASASCCANPPEYESGNARVEVVGN